MRRTRRSGRPASKKLYIRNNIVYDPDIEAPDVFDGYDYDENKKNKKTYLANRYEKRKEYHEDDVI